MADPVRAYPLVGALADRPATPDDKDIVYFAVDGETVVVYVCSDTFQWIEVSGGGDDFTPLMLTGWGNP